MPALKPLQRVSGGVLCSSTAMLFSNRKQVKASYVHVRDSRVLNDSYMMTCTYSQYLKVAFLNTLK